VSKRNQDFDMYAGESKTVFIAITNSDGSAFNPVGATMEWWMAKTNHSAKTIAKTLSSGLALSTGGVNILLESDDTYDLKPEIYYHELKITMPSGLSVATVGAVHLRPALDMRLVVTP
jgi:hypothetical protein